MKENNRRKLTTRIIVGVAITLALVYVVFLFVTTNFLGTNNIVTETAYRATAYDIIKTTALVARDEEYISGNSSGILVYEAFDADKVTADGTIATIYNNENDVVSRSQIEQITERIAYLEQLSTVTGSNIGLDTVNAQISEHLESLIGCVNNRTFDLLADSEEELMSSIYRKQVITGEQLGFSDKISELTQERKELEASCGQPAGYIKSKSSGYFVSSVDGYENAFDIDALDAITYTDFQNIKPAEIPEGKYVGKVLRDVSWYLVCPISPDDATNLQHSNYEIKVRLPYVSAEQIPAKVMSVHQFADEEKAMAVLRCNYMSEALSKIRSESVEILVNEYEGLKFAKSALHDDYVTKTTTDDSGKKTQEKVRVQGVYVEYGNELRFKQVALVYSGDDYVICNENPGDAIVNGRTVELYDRVVVEGSELYDGKLLD